MPPAKDTAGVLAPPPVIYLFWLLVGLGLDRLWPLPFLPQNAQYLRGGTLSAASLLLAAWVLRALLKAKTSIDPYKPTTAIITTGPFARSRNPAYVALAVLCLGIGLAIDSLWALVTVVPAVATIQRFVILREEAYLERKFGEDYRNYKDTVRRWL